jgi:hypothetical protein
MGVFCPGLKIYGMRGLKDLRVKNGLNTIYGLRDKQDLQVII